MKTKLVAIVLSLFVSAAVVAQKYAYVDTKYILENLDEYKEAQRQLDELSEKWQKDLEQMMATLETKRASYEAEKALLLDEQKETREKELKDLQNELLEFQKKKFGVGGELFSKRQQLIEPIQDKIYKEIKNVAESGNYSFIFDSAMQSNILYADKKLDKSDLVLRNLKK
ncbi:MAG: OmpH family outer membrane protein [Bacteroidia bacterium]